MERNLIFRSLFYSLVQIVRHLSDSHSFCICEWWDCPFVVPFAELMVCMLTCVCNFILHPWLLAGIVTFWVQRHFLVITRENTCFTQASYVELWCTTGFLHGLMGNNDTSWYCVMTVIKNSVNTAARIPPSLPWELRMEVNGMRIFP